MVQRKCMTVSLTEQVERMFENSIKEREQARKDVRDKKVKGYIDLNGDVTVRVDAISSVIYRNGSTTYVW